MMNVGEIFDVIISYADIGVEEEKQQLLPMETVFLAILLVIFYYKLFVTVGCMLFEWIYSSDLQNQFSKTLALDDDYPRQEFPRHSKKTNVFKKQN